METRVSLSQYQTPPFSSFSPYHTTSTPAGARQTVLLVRLFQKYVLPACFSLSRNPLDGVLQLSCPPWMGSTRGGSSDPECEAQLRTFFYFGEKCEKPLHQAHLRVLQHQLESEKKMNSDLGENQEDFHEKQGQRSAPQSAQKCVFWKATLLNAVLGENLEDQNLILHHQELECRRAVPQSAVTKSKTRSSVLPPAVPPAA